jgi:predicted naringenin-chalcone synthase
MGCAGGTAGLIYARELARARPAKKVALLSLEAPSLTFIRDDHSMENLVSAAIFADGVACVLVGAEGPGIEIADADMYHFPRSTRLMGYELRDDGFKIILDREVPSAIREHFPRIVLPFLARNGLAPGDVGHYLFHPGGKHILRMVEDFARTHGRDVDDSRFVLEHRGNMSSATVLHVLERTSARAKPGDVGYMLAFGPGFTAQSLLLRFGE